MYTPRYSEENRRDVLVALMRRHPFAVLVSAGASGLRATHLPVVVREGPGEALSLQMHVARPNPQWRDLPAEVLLVFSGPHAYVSPAWYRSGEPTVPTWNYAALHAYGAPRTFEGDELRRHLGELVATNEAANGTAWTMRGTPERYLAGLQQGIVGIEIAVTRLEGKMKMSQNRAPEDRDGAIAGLEATGHPDNLAVARWMRELSPG